MEFNGYIGFHVPGNLWFNPDAFSAPPLALSEMQNAISFTVDSIGQISCCTSGVNSVAASLDIWTYDSKPSMFLTTPSSTIRTGVLATASLQEDVRAGFIGWCSAAGAACREDLFLMQTLIL